MSFSSEIRTELLHIPVKKAHCLKAKDAAAAFLSGEDAVLPQRDCCRKTFLRAVFLSIGHVSDPEKSYHAEFALKTDEQAPLLTDLLSFYGLNMKTVHRKGQTILYCKEGEQISDLLNLLGAHQALMSFENTRILKSMRNSLNRRVNCEAANLGKTATASVRQLSDIQTIEETIGLSALSDALRETAEQRLANPDLSIAELGQTLDPPVGKSGMNHRFRRLAEIAERLRG